MLKKLERRDTHGVLHNGVEFIVGFGSSQTLR